MADSEELKHMVMNFRVSELQVLLGYAGRNKSGRKQELLERAVQLVQKGCSTQVQIKIRDLHRQIYASNQRRGREGLGVMGAGDASQQMVNPAMAPMGLENSLKNYSPCIKGVLDYTNTKVMQPAPVGPIAAPIPIHPDVHLKRLAFYDICGELLKPTSLMPKTNNRFQEAHYVFHLTPQQAQDIGMSRDIRPGMKFEYTTQVQLRFCLLETSCEQDDNFPPSICVRVNSKMAQLPNPIPTNKPGVEPKRPGRPVDITPICRISPTVSNHLEVSWASEFGRGYCLAVYLVKRLSSDNLLQRLKQFGNRHPDHTRALIKEKLAHDPDSEVATTSLRVTLMCPLGKMRMTIPCRSSTCTHLQCFDASTFLQMNEKKPTWICPVCDKPAPFDKLIIDGYFVEIFRQSPESNEIVFTEDGNWSSLKQSKETLMVSSPMTPQAISIDDPSEPEPAACQENGGGNKKGEVIDLTVSSDEEDDVTMREEGPGPTIAIAAAHNNNLGMGLGLGLGLGLGPPGEGPSHLSSDGSNSSCGGGMSPAVINLDTSSPSPALSVHSLSASPGPAPSMPVSQPSYSNPNPNPNPSLPSMAAAPIPAPAPAHHAYLPPQASRPQHHHHAAHHRNPHYPAGGAHRVADPSVQMLAGAGRPVVPMQQPNIAIQAQHQHQQQQQPLNLEALSEAEFEEFLHGLSWDN